MRWIVNIATSYVRFGTSMLTVFLMMPFVIASIGMEQFGLWSLLFAVVGLFGLLYWYVLYPLHSLVFAGMLRGVVRAVDGEGKP